MSELRVWASQIARWVTNNNNNKSSISDESGHATSHGSAVCASSGIESSPSGFLPLPLSPSLETLACCYRYNTRLYRGRRVALDARGTIGNDQNIECLGCLRGARLHSRPLFSPGSARLSLQAQWNRLTKRARSSSLSSHSINQRTTGSASPRSSRYDARSPQWPANPCRLGHTRSARDLLIFRFHRIRFCTGRSYETALKPRLYPAGWQFIAGPIISFSFLRSYCRDK